MGPPGAPRASISRPRRSSLHPLRLHVTYEVPSPTRASGGRSEQQRTQQQKTVGRGARASRLGPKCPCSCAAQNRSKGSALPYICTKCVLSGELSLSRERQNARNSPKMQTSHQYKMLRIVTLVESVSKEDERLPAKHEEGRAEETVQGGVQPEGTAARAGSKGEDCGAAAGTCCACACRSYDGQGQL